MVNPILSLQYKSADIEKNLPMNLNPVGRVTLSVLILYVLWSNWEPTIYF